MTCSEIVDDVESEIRYAFKRAGEDMPATEEIVRVANKYNTIIARDLRIPTRYVKDIDATAAFALPSEALPGSVRFTEQEEDEDRIEVLTVNEANAYYPDWELNEHEGESRYPTKIIIYDPGNISAPVYPIGFTSGDLLRMVYVMAVDRMVLENEEEEDDVSLQPFNGLMPEYHRTVAQMTKFELLMRVGDPRAQAYYQDAQDEIQRAYAYRRDDVALPRVPNLGLR